MESFILFLFGASAHVFTRKLGLMFPNVSRFSFIQDLLLGQKPENLLTDQKAASFNELDLSFVYLQVSKSIVTLSPIYKLPFLREN